MEPFAVHWLRDRPRGINESANFRFLQSCRDYRPRKMASCRDCPFDSVFCQDSRQEARGRGQSRWKPNMKEATISGLAI